MDKDIQAMESALQAVSGHETEHMPAIVQGGGPAGSRGTAEGFDTS